MQSFLLFIVMVLSLFSSSSGFSFLHSSGVNSTLATKRSDGVGDTHPGPISAAEKEREQKKAAAVAAWVKQRHFIRPQCIPAPGGGCDYPASLGGQYVEEPSDEGNWCGPGAATTTLLHDFSSTVTGYGSITVRNNAGGYSTYSGGQGFMAYFAAVMPVTFYKYQVGKTVTQNGIMNWPYSDGADATAMVAGLNNYEVKKWGFGYYAYNNPTSESNLINSVQFDIGHDHEPVVYSVNTDYLANWPHTWHINHYVEGYGYVTGTDNDVDYADTAYPTLQGNQPGDYYLTNDQMWAAVENGAGQFSIW